MTKPLSIVFCGTEYLAEAMLQSLLSDERFIIKTVITQPDRPVGRKQILQAPPVKELALKHNFNVIQPTKLRETSPEILGDRPDFLVVAEFGQLIPETWRTFPIIDTINVHPSLLPKYRGATPIQSALLNGDAITGVTIMQLEPTMDTGPIVATITAPLGTDDVYETVEAYLAALAGPLLNDSLVALANNTIKPTPQDHTLATHCRKLTRDSGRINWSQSAQAIYNQYRALHRWPGIWTTWTGLRLKLLAVKPNPTSIAPGKIEFINNTLLIGTGAGSLEISRLQLEGRSAVDAKAFMAGAAEFIGGQVE